MVEKPTRQKNFVNEFVYITIILIVNYNLHNDNLKFVPIIGVELYRHGSVFRKQLQILVDINMFIRCSKTINS